MTKPWRLTVDLNVALNIKSDHNIHTVHVMHKITHTLLCLMSLSDKTLIYLNKVIYLKKYSALTAVSIPYDDIAYGSHLLIAL